MKIWHISDTHNLHLQLKVPQVDCVIFSGDCSSNGNLAINFHEVLAFFEWYAILPIKHKIFVGGNHDLTIERGLYSVEEIKNRGISYLMNDSVVVEGFKIWGSPYTPSYGHGWAWNRKRGKINEVWDLIPDDTDILVTHGPPQGILDYTVSIDGNIENCGCSNLKKRIDKLNIKASLFGHIHNYKWIKNSGVFRPAGSNTVFSNASCVEDGKMNDLISHGNIICLRENFYSVEDIVAD